MLYKHLANAGFNFTYLRYGIQNIVSDNMETTAFGWEIKRLLEYFHLITRYIKIYNRVV